jgi:hypothetical protein|tara:strand:- start:489 stop:689 length:201 start_codon:yes stop_codon:yes gene_type:complete
MGIYKHIQNICKDDKDGISYVVVPKIINSDVGFQLMFGRLLPKEPVSVRPIRNEESIKVSDHYQNY